MSQTWAPILYMGTGPTGTTLPIQGPGTGSILLKNTDPSNVYFSTNLQVLATTVAVSGDLVPQTTLGHNLGSPTRQWNSLYVGTGSIHMGQDLILSGSFIGSAPTGPTGPVFTTNSHFIPNASDTLSLGSYTNPWKEMYVGPGSLNIAGPAGASATLGSDQNGIAFSAKGFATPFINIGPNINAIDTPGAIGGWVLAPTGDPGNNTYDLIVQQKLAGASVPAGLTGPVYSLIKNPTFTGPTGIQGQNGITGGLTLFFDTAGGSISGAAPTPVSGTLQTIPTQTAQTTIVYSGTSSNIQVASFITPVNQIVSPIVAGLWSVNLYALSNHSSHVSCYATISSVDADGTSTKTLIVSGSAGPINIPDVQGVYTQDLFVPTTTLAAGKRIIIDLYVKNSSGNNTVTFEFRSTTLSHVHTTIIGNVATGPTGPTGPSPPGNYYFVRGQLLTNQTITVSDAVIQFSDVSGGDPQGWSSGDGSSNFRITPTIEGYYQINLNVNWEFVAAAGDQLNNQIQKNGQQIAFAQGTNVTVNSVSLSLTAFTYMNGTTDYIEFKGFSGASGGTVLAANTGTAFSLFLIQGGTSTTPTTGKTFIIDHPTDFTRHLVHACLEGPEVGVYYRGKGRIEEGTTETTIQLPSYVRFLAYNFTVQITPIGKVQMFAASEVIDGAFHVFGQPGAFYWHVHASRGSLEVEPLKSAVTVRGEGPYKYLV